MSNPSLCDVRDRSVAAEIIDDLAWIVSKSFDPSASLQSELTRLEGESDEVAELDNEPHCRLLILD